MGWMDRYVVDRWIKALFAAYPLSRAIHSLNESHKVISFSVLFHDSKSFISVVATDKWTLSVPNLPLSIIIPQITNVFLVNLINRKVSQFC